MLLWILWATPYRDFFLACRMLWVMLASFFFHLVRLHLANLFHYLLQGMLHRLQYLDEKVGIISKDPLLLLWSNPRFVNTFHLVGLVLVAFDE